MKIVELIVRTLLGLVFVVFGLNGFLNFMKGDLPPGLPGQFLGALVQSHYILAVCVIFIIGGLLLVINRYVILGLVLLAPIIVNILLYHAFMAPSSIGMGLVVTLFWCFLAFYHRRHLASLFVQRT